MLVPEATCLILFPARFDWGGEIGGNSFSGDESGYNRNKSWKLWSYASPTFTAQIIK